MLFVRVVCTGSERRAFSPKYEVIYEIHDTQANTYTPHNKREQRAASSWRRGVG